LIARGNLEMGASGRVYRDRVSDTLLSLKILYAGAGQSLRESLVLVMVMVLVLVLVLVMVLVMVMVMVKVMVMGHYL